MDTELISAISHSVELELTGNISQEELREKLSRHINYLIENDFQKLVNILYRIDVSETKLKTLLSENKGEDSGNIIAGLIMERQFEKIKTRRQFNQRDQGISNDEAW